MESLDPAALGYPARAVSARGISTFTTSRRVLGADHTGTLAAQINFAAILGGLVSWSGLVRSKGRRRQLSPRHIPTESPPCPLSPQPHRQEAGATRQTHPARRSIRRHRQ